MFVWTFYAWCSLFHSCSLHCIHMFRLAAAYLRYLSYGSNLVWSIVLSPHSKWWSELWPQLSAPILQENLQQTPILNDSRKITLHKIILITVSMIMGVLNVCLINDLGVILFILPRRRGKKWFSDFVFHLNMLAEEKSWMNNEIVAN